MTDVFYFGCVQTSGHFLWDTSFRTLSARTTPWGNGIDGKLCPGTVDRRLGCVPTEEQEQGRAVLHHRDGWTALAFWDRSVDERGGSNSVFVARGTFTADEMIAKAREAFPRIWARFGFEVRV
jgi:hypothetical protein